MKQGKTNRNQKKDRETLKKEKELNRSLITLPREIQNGLGLVAIQKEKDVFVRKNNDFCKIYSIKSSPLPDEVKLPFLELLCKKTMRRIRITSFCKGKDGKVNTYAFLTVFFEAESYAAVCSQIEEFEYMLVTEVCKPLNIILSRCTIDSLLAFMYMNATGKMKQFCYEDIIGKNKKIKKELFADFSLCKNEIFKSDEKYGVVYFGKELPEEPVALNPFLANLNAGIQIVIDIQSMTDTEKELYEFELQKIYNCVLNPTEQKFINMTYLLSALSDSEQEMKQLNDEIMNKFTDNNILLLPCTGREKEVFQSICTFGLLDFRSMRIVDLETASSFLL